MDTQTGNRRSIVQRCSLALFLLLIIAIITYGLLWWWPKFYVQALHLPEEVSSETDRRRQTPKLILKDQEVLGKAVRLSGVSPQSSTASRQPDEPKKLTQKERLELNKSRLEVENTARNTMVTLLGGIFLLWGAICTWQSYQLSRQGQITERFNNAIAHFGEGEGNLTKCLGGLYALERIARESDRDYWTVMEVLTARLRTGARWSQWRPTISHEAYGEEAEPSPAGNDPPTPHPAPETQAILDVLCRRERRYGQGETKRLDLRTADLRGANLRVAPLKGVDLRGANLRSACLEGAFLQIANLSDAQLQKAHLEKVHLEGAHLHGAHLQAAHLNGARLDGTEFNGADLMGADFAGANFTKETRLTEANLKDSKLEEAIGLSWENILNQEGEGVYSERCEWREAALPRQVKAEIERRLQKGLENRGRGGGNSS